MDQTATEIFVKEVLRPTKEVCVSVNHITRSSLDGRRKGWQLSVDNLKHGLATTSKKNVDGDEVTLLAPLWSALYHLENECDVVVFGIIYDPILKLLKNLILTAVPTVETVFCKEFTMAILKKRRMRDLINPKFPILTNDEIEAVKHYNVGVASFPGEKLLTPYMKTVKINQLRRLMMAMIDSPTGCTSDEIVRFYKYCKVIFDGIRHNLDWTKAETELGIKELTAKYMTKEHKRYKVITIK